MLRFYTANIPRVQTCTFFMGYLEVITIQKTKYHTKTKGPLQASAVGHGVVTCVRRQWQHAHGGGLAAGAGEEKHSGKWPI